MTEGFWTFVLFWVGMVLATAGIIGWAVLLSWIFG